MPTPLPQSPDSRLKHAHGDEKPLSFRVHRRILVISIPTTVACSTRAHASVLVRELRRSTVGAANATTSNRIQMERLVGAFQTTEGSRSSQPVCR
jgi:hypothetical protein